MKGYKKVLSLLSASAVAATTIIGSGAAVFAADNTVTLPAGRTYDIYQIFTGTVGADGKLGSIVWGDDGTGTTGVSVSNAVLTKLQNVNVEGKSATEKFAVIDDYADLTADNEAYAKNYEVGDDGNKQVSSTTVSLPDGYYIFHDVTEFDSEDDSKDANSYYVTEIVGGTSLTVTTKVAVPDVDKEVEDEQADGTKGYGEAADHQIGESFNFKLTATLPSNNSDLDDYSEYYMQFKDTPSKGVTKEAITGVVITYQGTNYDITKELNSRYTTNFEANGDAFTLTISDLVDVLKKETKSDSVSLQGVKVTVTYSAHLNGDANTVQSNNDDATFENGKVNENSVSLVYSNNPTWTGDGTTGEVPPTDETPEDHVWVFAYNLPILKTNVAGDAKLADAEFELYADKDLTEKLDFVEIKDAGNSTGTYRLYSDGDDTKGSDYTTTVKTNADGELVIKGLESKTYYLKETKQPNGYVLLTDPVAITLGSTENENGDEASAKNTFTTSTTADATIAETTADDATVTIKNKPSSSLPSTGGQGTTMILLFGAAAVAGGVALKSRRKLAK